MQEEGYTVGLENLTLLYKIARPKAWMFLGSVFFIFIASLFELFGITLLIPLLNAFLAGGDFLSSGQPSQIAKMLEVLPLSSNLSILIFFISLILCSIVISNLLFILSGFCMSKFSSDISHSLRTKIFARYLLFEKKFYDRCPTGTLMSVLMDNTRQLTGTLGGLRASLAHIIMAGSFFMFLIFISWKFTLFTIPVIGMVYYSLRWLVRKLKASAKEEVAAMRDIYEYAPDILSNMQLVHSYAFEDWENTRFNKKSQTMERHTFNVGKKESAIPRLTEVIAHTSFVFLAFFFASMSIRYKIFSPSVFFVYFYAMMRFVAYLKNINEIKAIIARIEPLAEKILWAFDDTDKEIMKSGEREFKCLKNRIDFKNVSFGYAKDKLVIKNIDLSIEKGSLVALVGPTGAGKTTIAHLLCRFYDVDEGSIEIDGADIRAFTLESLRRKIAIVSQETLMLNTTIRNNIAYGLGPSIEQDRIDDAARKAQIYEFIKALPGGYETIVGEKGVRLSGGEKQRISIARALLKNAEILILDEATSSLDSETELLVQKAMENLVEHKTVLAIAHRLSTIRNAQKVIVLKGGCIVEQGEFGELIDKKGEFARYWDHQKFY
jgi:ABC-type multidrug transport system fused ATPase/permease subunit